MCKPKSTRITSANTVIFERIFHDISAVLKLEITRCSRIVFGESCAAAAAASVLHFGLMSFRTAREEEEEGVGIRKKGYILFSPTRKEAITGWVSCCRRRRARAGSTAKKNYASFLVPVQCTAAAEC